MMKKTCSTEAVLTLPSFWITYYELCSSKKKQKKTTKKLIVHLLISLI